MAVSNIGNAFSAQTLRKQFVESFENEHGARASGLQWLRNSIATFEHEYGMTSAEMIARVRALEIDETDDICSWLIKVDLLRDVEPET
ncbi:MAG: hypothetical protein M3457_05980 [Chloroflexota bacterium]|nr:hypothetical protein [Chloroflexota bacterium]